MLEQVYGAGQAALDLAADVGLGVGAADAQGYHQPGRCGLWRGRGGQWNAGV